MTPDKAPRRWRLESLFEDGDDLPVVKEGPSVSGYDAEIEVIEASAYDQKVEENSYWQRHSYDAIREREKQIATLEAQLQRERRKVEIALEALHDIKAHCRDRSIPQGMEYAKCLSVSASAILELEAIEQKNGT